MSGIFGFFNRNGKPADKKIADAMLEAVSYWDPDERHVVLEGAIAFGHAMLWNTPESKYEHPPLQRDGLMLTMDARIDNRDELVNKLDLPDRPLERIGDSEFILAAYRKWGEECPEHLLGDFSFVIWDEEKQMLFCARDHIGVKPFYYHTGKDLFVFGNDMRSLLAHQEVAADLDDEAVALYLNKGELWHPTLTFYESIRKLPPASIMTVTNSAVSTRTYWKPEDCLKPDRYADFNSYQNRLRELLEDAVRVRLRTGYRVSSHLSGGLDSSTVAVLAARQLAQMQKSLKAFSWISSPKKEDDHTHYEWSNSRLVAQHEGMDLEHINLDGKNLSEILMHHDISYNDTVDLWYEFILRKKAQAEDIRTVLSGWGGDELISHNGRAYYSDLFRQGRVLDALKGLWHECRQKKNKKRCFISRFYRKVFLPSLPYRFLCLMPRVNCAQYDYLQCATGSFVRFARQRSVHPLTFMYKKDIRTDQLDLYRQGHIVSRLESWSSSAFENRLEYSFPLLDRRIVELAMRLPADFYYHNGTNRLLFRNAVTGIVPERIQWGNFKHEPKRGEQIFKHEIEAFSYLMDYLSEHKSRLAHNRYIDVSKLQESILKLLQKKKYDAETVNEMDTIEKSFLILCIRSNFNDYLKLFRYAIRNN